MPRKGDAAQPVGSFTASIDFPIFPMASRCTVCAIFRTDEEAFTRMTEMLMLGHEQKEVLAYLHQQGIDVSDKALSRHYHNHFLGYYHEALEIERRLRAEQAAMSPDTPSTIASALARSLAMRGLEAVNLINMKALAAGADAKTIKALAELARTIAAIDHMTAQRKLTEKQIQLRAIDLDLKAGKLDQVAARWISMRLQDDPEKALKVLELLDLPTPPKELKALSATTEPKPNASRKRSRTQKARRSSARTKR